ncbi:MAG: hypothetical protein MR598_08160 [Erysipelotrichaceae bacterium]|nr:hypothetical protein [Erysipelotrichaceae bacterium]
MIKEDEIEAQLKSKREFEKEIFPGTICNDLKLVGEGYDDSYLFQSIHQLYYIVLKELSQFMEDLNCNSSIEVFAMYSYLVRNGFLSYNGIFRVRNVLDRLDSLFGVSVIEGEGVCRHISSFLTDLLKVRGCFCFNLGMVLGKKSKYFSLNSDSYLTYPDNGSDSLFISIIRKVMVKINGANHLITFVRDEHGSYLLDALNDILFLVDDQNRVFSYKGNSYFSIKYVDFFNENQRRNLKNILTPTLLDDREEFVQPYFDTWNKCYQCTDLFENFYHEHQELYREIVVKKRELIK